MSQQCVEFTVSLAWTNSIVNNLYDVKENYEYALHLALHLSRFSVCPTQDMLVLSSAVACAAATAVQMEIMDTTCTSLQISFAGPFYEAVSGQTTYHVEW
jgi:hypothetical protein